MRLRFTFISLGIGWRRGAILRRTAKRKTRKKRKSTPFFAVGGLASGLSAGRVCPVDHLRLLYVLDKSSMAEGVCGLTAVRHASVPGVFHNLHCAHLGESTPGVRRKSPTLLWRRRYAATASTSLSIRRRRVGRAEAASVRLAAAVLKVDASLYRWRWL